MARIHLVEHAPGAPGLRWLGLGPGLRPARGLLKLRRLLNKHAFWAQDRSRQQLREVERVYLMTTNSNGFYEQMGFSTVSSQQLLIRKQ